MVIEIQSFSSKNKILFNEAIKIRFNVFVNEFKVDKDLDYDGNDFDATHYIVKVDNEHIGTSRWREYENCIYIERFTILKEYRKNGFGTVLLNFILKELKNAKQPIYIFTPKKYIPYYQKLNFHKVEINNQHTFGELNLFKLILK